MEPGEEILVCLRILILADAKDDQTLRAQDVRQLFSEGTSWMQGGHHVAQKLRISSLPPKSRAVIVLPLSA